MKRCLYILSAISLFLSCVSETAVNDNLPETISIITEGNVFLGSGTTAFVDVALTPAGCDLTDGRTSVSIEVVHSNIGWFQGSAPIFYTLAGIERTGSPGKFKVGIRDLGKGEKYVDQVRLVVKTITDEGTRKICSQDFVLEFSGNSISSLAFLKKDNPTALISDFDISQNSSYITLASPYITSPELALSFKTDAAKVLVGEVEQISGKTINDFSKPVTYSFVSAVGEVRKYTIQVRHSGLPVMVINTPGAAEIPPKTEDWLSDATVTVYRTDCTIDYAGVTNIRGRGNSTWKYPKKPYALKLESKAEILGMPKHKRWVLLANWLDRTLLRNHVSFRIAMQTGLEWTPRGEFVEVILNGKHIGNYYLCEHIKVDKNRVNIDELDENEVDGGYLMELDTYYDEDFKFKSSVKKFPYMFKDPDEVNDSQLEFMKGFIDNLEGALYDKARFAAREYADYIDIDSFIDWWISYELTGNTETKHPKSTYVHKDKGGRLKAGPVWDFDWKTFRSDNEEWVTRNHLYYDVLFTDPLFVDRVKERWNMHVAKLRAIPKFIESEADRIRNSEDVNHQMWPVTQNTNGDIDLSFSEAVARMKRSYEAKLEFMDRGIQAMSGAAVEEVPPMGRSVGRWSGFGLESMKVNKAGGLDYIEVTMNDVIDNDPEGAPERARSLMTDIRESGLEVWSVHLPYSRTLDISVIDDSKRAANIQYMKDMIRVAGIFAPHYLVLHPSSEPISAEEREQRLKNSHAAIGELAPVAKEIGAILCIENLPRTCLGQNGEEMMRLIEGYDEVGLCFDTNHLLYQSHADFLKAIGKGKIKTVHISDYDFVDERHLLPGKGLIDCKALWKGIKDNGYDGIMMFECHGNATELDAARQLLLGDLPQ